MIMVSVLCLSTLVAFLNLAWNYRKQQAKAAKAAVEAAQSIARTISRLGSRTASGLPLVLTLSRSSRGSVGSGDGTPRTARGSGSDGVAIDDLQLAVDSRRVGSCTLGTIGEIEEESSATEQAARRQRRSRCAGRADYSSEQLSTPPPRPGMLGRLTSALGWRLSRPSDAYATSEFPSSRSSRFSVGGVDVTFRRSSSRRSSCMSDISERSTDSESGIGVGVSPCAPQSFRRTCSKAIGNNEVAFNEAQLRLAVMMMPEKPPPPPHLFAVRRAESGAGLPDYAFAPPPPPPPPPMPPPEDDTPPPVPLPAPGTMAPPQARPSVRLLVDADRTPSFRARKVSERVVRARQLNSRQRAAAAGSARARASLAVLPQGMQASIRAAATDRRFTSASDRSSDPDASIRDSAKLPEADSQPCGVGAVGSGVMPQKVGRGNKSGGEGAVSIPIDPSMPSLRQSSKEGMQLNARLSTIIRRASLAAMAGAPNTDTSQPPTLPAPVPPRTPSSIVGAEVFAGSAAGARPSQSRIRRSSSMSVDDLAPTTPTTPLTPPHAVPQCVTPSDASVIATAETPSKAEAASQVETPASPRTSEVALDIFHVDRNSRRPPPPLPPPLSGAAGGAAVGAQGVPEESGAGPPPVLPRSAGSFRAILPAGSGTGGGAFNGLRRLSTRRPSCGASSTTCAPADDGEPAPPWGGIRLRSVAARRQSCVSSRFSVVTQENSSATPATVATPEPERSQRSTTGVEPSRTSVMTRRSMFERQ